MFQNLRRGVAGAISLIWFCGSAIAAAEPKAVLDALKGKRWEEARVMLVEVVREKPSSAKAWYLLALAQAEVGRLSEARASLARARVLRPGLDFATPDATIKLDELLVVVERSQEFEAQATPHTEPVAEASSDSLPFLVLIGGGAGLLALLGYALMRRQRR